MDNLNENPIKLKTERSKSISTRSTTKINADRERELQRLKNLGVVSVLNKTFNSQDNGMLLTPTVPPLPSPSSSTSTSNSTAITTTTKNKKILSKSSSTSHLSFTPKQSYANANIPTDNKHEQWIVSLLPPEYNEPYVPGKLDEKGNSLMSGVDATYSSYTNEKDKEDINKLATYDALLKEHQLTKHLLNQAELTTKNTIESWTEQKAMDSYKVHQLSEIIIKQDQMIIELEKSLSSTLEENNLLKTVQHQDINNNNNNSNSDHNEQQKKMDLELKKELYILRKELSDLQKQKSDYEQRIISLCSDLETSQDQTRKLILITEELKRDNNEQKIKIDEKIEKMTKMLLEKDILIQRYRNNYRNSYMEFMNQYMGHDHLQRRLSRRSSQYQHNNHRDSQHYYRDSQYLDDNATVHSSTSFGSSYSERSVSGSRLSYSSMNRPILIHSNSHGGNNRYSRETLPKRKEKSKGNVLSWPPMDPIPPPTGPPPSIPLPPLPILENNDHPQEEKEEIDPVLEKEKNDHHQQRLSSSSSSPIKKKKEIEEVDVDELEEIKSSDSSTMSSNHHLSINDENLRQGLTSSLEMLLLLQSPSKFTLDDEETMKEAYREFTEQLQSRLSISKEIDQLQVWDHEALERIQKRSSNLSHPITTTTSTSSSKKSISSIPMESTSLNTDEKNHNTAFWKGMKKKLRV